MEDVAHLYFQAFFIPAFSHTLLCADYNADLNNSLFCTTHIFLEVSNLNLSNTKISNRSSLVLFHLVTIGAIMLNVLKSFCATFVPVIRCKRIAVNFVEI